MLLSGPARFLIYTSRFMVFWGFVFFFLHFLTDPFYSQDPRAAITKRTPCQPQSQSLESTYNGRFQPGKPQQSRLVFRARCLKSQDETGQAGEQEQYLIFHMMTVQLKPSLDNRGFFVSGLDWLFPPKVVASTRLIALFIFSSVD